MSMVVYTLDLCFYIFVFLTTWSCTEKVYPRSIDVTAGIYEYVISYYTLPCLLTRVYYVREYITSPYSSTFPVVLRAHCT